MARSTDSRWKLQAEGKRLQAYRSSSLNHFSPLFRSQAAPFNANEINISMDEAERVAEVQGRATGDPKGGGMKPQPLIRLAAY